jgi:hypothetical protein
MAPGGDDAETELVPPATVAAPQHAWSHEEPATEAFSQPWRSAWAIAAAGLVSAVIVAFAVFGVVTMVQGNHHATQASPTPTYSPAAHPPPPPAMATATPPAALPAPAFAPTAPSLAPGPIARAPDDDEFVAIAISPRALATMSDGGFGTSGTQGTGRIKLRSANVGRSLGMTTASP